MIYTKRISVKRDKKNTVSRKLKQFVLKVHELMVSYEGIFTSSRFSMTTQFSDTWHEVERPRERERGHSVSRPNEGRDEMKSRSAPCAEKPNDGVRRPEGSVTRKRICFSADSEE